MQSSLQSVHSCNMLHVMADMHTNCALVVTLATLNKMVLTVVLESTACYIQWQILISCLDMDSFWLLIGQKLNFIFKQAAFTCQKCKAQEHSSSQIENFKRLWPLLYQILNKLRLTLSFSRWKCKGKYCKFICTDIHVVMALAMLQLIFVSFSMIRRISTQNAMARATLLCQFPICQEFV